MATTLISIYDLLTNADQAREELLASGFAADCIHLDARETEAGPVKGNFTVGDGGKGLENKPRRFFSSSEVYDRDYANVEYRAEIMLTVDAEDEAQRRKAARLPTSCIGMAPSASTMAAPAPDSFLLKGALPGAPSAPGEGHPQRFFRL